MAVAPRRWSVLVLALAFVVAGLFVWRFAFRSADPGRLRELLNRGLGQVQDAQWLEAEKTFVEATRVDAQDATAAFGAAVTTLRGSRDAAAALARFEAYRKLEPDTAIGLFGSAVALRRAERFEEAVDLLQRAAKLAPDDADIAYFTGDSLHQIGRDPEALAWFEKALAADATDIGALHNIAQLVRRTDPARSTQLLDRAKELKRAGLAELHTQSDEWCRAFDRRLEVVPRTPPAEAPPLAVSWRTLDVGLPTGGATTFAIADFDADCDLDVAAMGAGMFKNDAGKFARVECEPLNGRSSEIRAGDFDNDGLPDLAANETGIAKNNGNLAFAAVAGSPSAGAGAPFLVCDFDHDGDLDLVTSRSGQGDGAPQLLRVFRNDLPPIYDIEGRKDPNAAAGQIKFTDLSNELRFSVGGTNIAFGDVQNDNATDLLTLGNGAPSLLLGARGGTFRIADSAGYGLSKLTASHVELADVDADGWDDIVASRPDDGSLYVARNRGDGTFDAAQDVAGAKPTAGAFVLADVDNDGDLDVVFGDGAHGRTLENVGPGTLRSASGAEIAMKAEVRSIDAADIDGDGATEILALESTGGIEAFASGIAAAAAHPPLRLSFEGHRSNRQAIGCKVEVRAGSFYAKRTIHRAPLDIAVGDRTHLDSLSVLWSNGVRQVYWDVTPGDPSWTPKFDRMPQQYREIEPAPCGPRGYLIRQIVRREGSCPLVFAWNGERFAYVNDFLCSSPLGLDLGGGHFAQPNPDDWIRIAPQQLVPKDGKLEIRLTEELREVTYLDSVQLVAVDHASDASMYLNSTFTFPPAPPLQIHAVKDARPVAGAVDQHGADVTERLAKVDRKYVDTFKRCRGPMQGMAEPHTLTLDLGDVKSAKRIRLFADGWFYWTDSSVNDALAQDTGWEFTPPLIDVGDGHGGWKSAGVLGIPAGDAKTVCVDLTDALDKSDPRVRLTTNLQIYFDRIFVALDDDPDAIARTTHELPPISATLHYRGYSARPFPDGKEPFVYDYEHLVPDATGYPIEYGRFAGAFTRYGDVMPLVTATDDMSVIMDNGDEIALSFDATKLPPLAPGMTRTWLLHSIGWAKDGDFHTLTSDTVMPLPFAAMTKYPYGQDGSGEKFPDDEAHRRWQAEWNTRLQTASPLVDAPRRAPPPMPSECDPADRMTFTDVTTAAGIDFHHSQGSVLVNLEDTMGAGCAFGDFDGDGDDDLYFVQGTGPTSRFAPGGAGDVGDARFLGKLYRNDGGCRFTDVTAAAGLLREGFGMGALFADLDNDGDEDLYVTNLGGNVLWRNDGGRFTDVTAQAGVAGGGFGSGIAAGDFDKDGDLDLCVGQYVEIDPKKRPQESPGFARGFVRDDPPSVLPYVYPAQRKFLFQNDGGLRFTDVAESAGVANAEGKTLGILFVDFDEDGWPDLYFANDVTPNAMFRNRGNGTFEDLSFDLGLDDPRGGMGVAAIDIDDDQDLDLLTTYWQTEPDALYRNNVVRHSSRKSRVPAFTDVGDLVGIAKPSIGVVGWGLDASDFDCDGALDLAIVNGYTSPDYETTDLCLPQPGLLFFGRRDPEHLTRFELAAGSAHGGFFGRALNGRGVAPADIDGDGDVDLAITQNNGVATLLRNDGGNAKNWLEVSLTGTASPRDAAGARVEVKIGDRVLTRTLSIGSSYLSCASKTLHFGLGDRERYDALTIHWPSGGTTALTGGAARARLRIVESNAK